MLQTSVSWEHNFIPTSQVRYFAYLVKTKKKTNKTKQRKTKQRKTKQNEKHICPKLGQI